MNKLMLLLLPLLALQAAAQFSPNPNLSFTPAKPEAGKTVSYNFDLTGTALNGKTVGAEVVQFWDEGIRSMDIAITQNGNTVTGNIPVNVDARMLVLNFYAENNDGKEITETAITPLYDANGSLLAGCRVLMANVLSGRAYIPGGVVKTDLVKALACFEDEMAANPSNKKYLPSYIALKLKVTKQEGREKMIQDLDNYVATEKEIPLFQLQEIKGLYTKLKSPEKATAMDERMKIAKQKEEANAPSPYKAFYTKLTAEKDAAKALELVDTYVKEHASEFKENGFPSQSSLYNMIINKAVDANNWKLADQVAKKFKSASEKQALASTYNSIAWRMSGEELDNKATDLPKALDLSKASVALMTGLIDKLNEKDVPSSTTPRRYKKQLENTRGMFADTYALLLYKKGNLKEAIKYQQMAAESYKSPDIMERLLVFRAKLNGNAAILEEAAALVKEGNASQKVMDLLKAAWTAQNDASGWEAYAAGLQKVYKEKLKNEWKQKMDNYAAPKFNLKDLQGNPVSLESLAGKVVVVDFWATWCGPCRASFPGMQKAQDLYKNDPNVKFVFVDTWENNKPEQIDKMVGAFIEKNKYPFHVLMDYDNTVIESFGVDGIPTKFIIDGKGHVRFKAVGFGGTDQKVVDEITTLIDLVKEQGNP